MKNIFVNNKYTKWYFSIINSRLAHPLSKSEYKEKHHIVPKSFYISSKTKNAWLTGDPDNKENFVSLTAHEHFTCHLLLTKMTSGVAYYKCLAAAKSLCSRVSTNQERYKVVGRTYEMLKKQFAKEHSARLKGVKTGRKNNGLTGHKQSAETIAKRVKSLKGQQRTDEQKKMFSKAQKNRKEKTQEEKEAYSKAMSKAKLGKPLGPCSDTHRKNISKSLRGVTKGVAKTEKTKAAMKKPKSESHKKNMSKPKVRISRIFDQREMSVNHYTRWVKSLND